MLNLLHRNNEWVSYVFENSKGNLDMQIQKKQLQRILKNMGNNEKKPLKTHQNTEKESVLFSFGTPSGVSSLCTGVNEIGCTEGYTKRVVNGNLVPFDPKNDGRYVLYASGLNSTDSLKYINFTVNPDTQKLFVNLASAVSLLNLEAHSLSTSYKSILAFNHIQDADQTMIGTLVCENAQERFQQENEKIANKFDPPSILPESSSSTGSNNEIPESTESNSTFLKIGLPILATSLFLFLLGALYLLRKKCLSKKEENTSVIEPQVSSTGYTSLMTSNKQIKF